jgi:hypothetical protein
VAFDGDDGALRAIRSSGNTIVQLDADGDSRADFAVTLIGRHDLDQTDFLLLPA